MAVQSKDISSHVATADDLARLQPGFLRLLGALLWVFSFIGNVFLFGGGWEALVVSWDTAAFGRLLTTAIAYSFVYQVLCTLIQFVFCKRWSHPVYLLALLASFLPSFIGYRPLIAGPLVAWAIGGRDPFAGVPLADVWSVLSTLSGGAILWVGLIHLFVAAVLVLADIIPERVYVKH